MVCDDSTNDGIETFNLTQQSQAIINGQDAVVLSFYDSLQDAENEENTIANPEQFVNSTNPQTIYYRLVNEDSNACYDVGFFDILVNPIGNVMTLPNLIACNEGFEILSLIHI